MREAPVLLLPRVTVQGLWGGHRVDDVGALSLHEGEAQVTLQHATLSIGWGHLSDATLEHATLHLHRAAEVLSLRGSPDLPRAWGHVVEQACALPEMARGLRALGTGRGGDAAQQARFFAPLLAARRRIQAPEAVERRVALFDAHAVAQRMSAVVGELVAERHVADSRRQRALAAHLEEALEPCLEALTSLGVAAEGVHRAGDGTRFVAWRQWTSALRQVFVEADRSWLAATRHLGHR